MLALWIFLGIVALLALLLFLPLRIKLRYTAQDGLVYRARYLFFTLADSNSPEYTQAITLTNKKRRKTKKSTKDSLLLLLGLDELASAADVKKAISKKGLLGFLQGIVSSVQYFLSKTIHQLGKGVFRKFELSITVADDDAADAALQYGKVCAVVYSLIALLSSKMKFRQRKLSLLCDYDKTHTEVFFYAQINYRLWHILSYLFFLAKNELEKERHGNE